MIETQPMKAGGKAARFAKAAFVAAALTAAVTPGVAGAQTLIELEDGMVQGQLNGATREFLGIPYAAPPVGPLRWRPPAAPTPWMGTLDATEYSSPCAQLPALTGTPSESEDCLYLNVWTPDPAPSEPKPVMIWIHGGSNVSGSTADGVPFPGFEGVRLYDGSIIADQRDTIVVTINYRLGVFGFFGHSGLAGEDVGYPYGGNQGLLDQRAAMQWVRDNIAAFGGDPDNVTIFGESAGSFDVCAHVVSPMSAGLFHRAISQSGGCSVGVRSQAGAEASADALSVSLGCDTAPDELACLRALPVADLLDAAAPLPDGSGADLAISIDGGFLPQHPRAILDAGTFNQVPYILGANSDEGSLFFIGADPIDEAEYTAELVSRYGTHAPAIEVMYPASDFPEPLDALIRVMGDSTLVCSTYDVAARVADAKGKAYVYNFARVPPLAFVAALDLGAFHGVEIAYVFGTVTPPTGTDLNLGRQMREYWTNFAAKGKPKATQATGWPRFKSKSWKMVRFNATLSKLTGYRQAECEFWRGLYETGDF